jgi:hypothetical protein
MPESTIERENVSAADFAEFASEAAQLPATIDRDGPFDRVVVAQHVPVRRNVPVVMNRIKVLAAAAGDDWYYRFPVRTKEGTKWIEGPSIQCTDDVAREYGNCQIDTRVLDMGPNWIIYARFADHETGYSMTRPFQQHKGQATLRTDDRERLENIALAIGVSKAIRNVVDHALRYLTRYAMGEAKRDLIERVGKNLENYRKRVLDRLGEMEIDPKRVERMRGRKIADWLAPDIALIIAEIQAVNDGMATAHETWPAGEEPKRSDFADSGTAKPGATKRKAAAPSPPPPKSPDDTPASGAGTGPLRDAGGAASGDTPTSIEPSPDAGADEPFDFYDAHGDYEAFPLPMDFAVRVLQALEAARSDEERELITANNKDEVMRVVPAIANTGSAWFLAEHFKVPWPTVALALGDKNGKPDYGGFSIHAQRLLQAANSVEMVDAFLSANRSTIDVVSAGIRNSVMLAAAQRKAQLEPEGKDGDSDEGKKEDAAG